MTDWKAQQAKADAAMHGTLCRQDDEGSRRLVEDMPPDELARTLAAIRQRLGSVGGEWWTKPPNQWGRVERNLFAAQYDMDLKAATIAAGRR